MDWDFAVTGSNGSLSILHVILIEISKYDPVVRFFNRHVALSLMLLHK